MNATPYSEKLDLAAVYAIAKALDENAARGGFYPCAQDEYLRHAMQLALRFETWARDRVDFGALAGVWAYELEDAFVHALRSAGFDPAHPEAVTTDEPFAKIASALKLPLL